MVTSDGAQRVDRLPRAAGREGDGKAAVLAAALRCFAARGYFGASMRDIAGEAQIAPAGIYHHFSGKQEILQAVMISTLKDVLATTRGRVSQVPDSDPAAQLAELVRAWVEFHALRQSEARVGASEIHCVEGEGRETVIALRDEQEEVFREVIERGQRAGVFATPHPRDAARAIINMGGAVASWYREDGSSAPEALAERYATLALAMVQAGALT
ncbi:TetR family transcriptional regulator [Leucobacter sp. BZR 635]